MRRGTGNPKKDPINVVKDTSSAVEKKFKQMETSLQRESMAEHLEDLKSHSRNTVLRLVERKIGELQKSLQASKDSETLKAQLSAWNLWKVNFEGDAMEESAGQDITKNFFTWLLGRGKEEDHRRTPWYRKPELLELDDVREWIDGFADILSQSQSEILKLVWKTPQSLDEAWLYYKYVVHMDWMQKEDRFFWVDMMNLLEDSKSLQGGGLTVEELEAPGGQPRVTDVNTREVIPLTQNDIFVGEDFGALPPARKPPIITLRDQLRQLASSFDLSGKQKFKIKDEVGAAARAEIIKEVKAVQREEISTSYLLEGSFREEQKDLVRELNEIMVEIGSRFGAGDPESFGYYHSLTFSDVLTELNAGNVKEVEENIARARGILTVLTATPQAEPGWWERLRSPFSISPTTIQQIDIISKSLDKIQNAFVLARAQKFLEPSNLSFVSEKLGAVPFDVQLMTLIDPKAMDFKFLRASVHAYSDAILKDVRYDEYTAEQKKGIETSLLVARGLSAFFEIKHQFGTLYGLTADHNDLILPVLSLKWRAILGGMGFDDERVQQFKTLTGYDLNLVPLDQLRAQQLQTSILGPHGIPAAAVIDFMQTEMTSTIAKMFAESLPDSEVAGDWKEFTSNYIDFDHDAVKNSYLGQMTNREKETILEISRSLKDLEDHYVTPRLVEDIKSFVSRVGGGVFKFAWEFGKHLSVNIISTTVTRIAAGYFLPDVTALPSVLLITTIAQFMSTALLGGNPFTAANFSRLVPRLLVSAFFATGISAPLPNKAALAQFLVGEQNAQREILNEMAQTIAATEARETVAAAPGVVGPWTGGTDWFVWFWNYFSAPAKRFLTELKLVQNRISDLAWQIPIVPRFVGNFFSADITYPPQAHEYESVLRGTNTTYRPEIDDFLANRTSVAARVAVLALNNSLADDVRSFQNMQEIFAKIPTADILSPSPALQQTLLKHLASLGYDPQYGLAPILYGRMLSELITGQNVLAALDVLGGTLKKSISGFGKIDIETLRADWLNHEAKILMQRRMKKGTKLQAPRNLKKKQKKKKKPLQ